MYNKIYPIYKREMSSYFYSSIAYIFLILFVFMTNIMFFYFFGGIFKEETASMRRYFTILPYVFTVFIPGLAMGSWAKEKSEGTIEMLFTYPVAQWKIVAGKFLAVLTLVGIALACSLFIPLLTQIFVGDFDWGQLFTQYLGALLMACAYIAVTFFMSSITSELIDSFLLSATTLLLLTLAGYVTSAYVMVFPDWLGWLKIFLNEISLSTHFGNFSKGVIHSKDVIYYLGIALVFFYCNIKALESKKWS